MKKKKILIVVIIVVIVIMVGLYLWTFLLGGRSLTNDTTATVDGRISYNADEEIEKALQDVNDGCEEADVIGSDPSQKEKTVSLAFYSLADSAVNDEILRMLEEYGYDATVFLTGLEAADNEDFVQKLLSEGNDLGSYGLKGVSQAETETLSDLVESFAHSQKVLTMLTDRAADMLYCSDTTYTSTVRQAAYASGYSRVVSVDSGNVLDYTSFESQKEVSSWLSGLDAGTLLLIRIDGKYEEIPDEPTVEPDTPAIDKQPDADILDTKTEEEPEENALELTEWLLKEMEKQEIKAVSADSLSALEETEQEEDGGVEKALVYRSFLTDQAEVALALWNLPDAESLQEITALLEQYGAGATFFVTEEELGERTGELTALAQDGYSLGNGGADIAACAKLLDNVADEKLMAWLPVSSLPFGELYEETELRQRAAAEGYVITVPENPEEPEAGAFYGIDLSEPDAAEQLETILAAVQDSGLAVRDVNCLMEDFGQIPSYTDAEIEELRTQNNGECEEAVSYVYTTERALSFLFYGVSNHPVMNDICSRLEQHNAAGTFFVTLDEMQQNGEMIEQLLSEGHEVGIAYVESDSYPANYDSVVRYLNSCIRYFRWRYDTELQTVFLPYAEANEEVGEAVSTMGLLLAGHNITIVQSADKDLTEDGIADVFEEELSKVSITRGSQIYFNANFYAADQDLADDAAETVCGAMVDAVFTNMIDPIAYQDPETGEIAEESRYLVKTCSAVRSSDECYTLTADLADCEIKESNSVVADMETVKEQMAYIAERYIGTPSADTSAELPGFKWRYLKKLDKTGRFTDEPVLFLSFDDWGTDASVNHLLYVLDKYNIKATFYVRTNYVENNPNLLRAIAEAGHEIASHTNSHLPLADYNEKTGTYSSLTDEEAAEVRADIVKSYEILYQYVGDVEVDGVTSLSKNFRPPTLAASAIGLTQVLDVGFEYIVSGDFSTHDYEAESVEELLDKFQNGISTWRGRQYIKNGSIIVMHMSEEAVYTAQALDEMIPIWQEEGYSFSRVDTGIAEAQAAEEAAEE